jgi:hypothetical protein
MPIKMELREQNRVMYYEVTDPWRLSEAYACYKVNNDLRNYFQHTIYTIANISAMREIPLDALSLRLYSPDLLHPRAGTAFLVGPSAVARSIIEIIATLSNPRKIRVVSTEEEAWDAIRAMLERETSTSR